ncbi:MULTISPECIES: acyltransferase family protein [Corynebacterium]|uniref:Putative acyltransferase n=1 Tax=Corynebacterium singulare TaxID=161899 RepID=A0A0B6F218_9CORY|nr:MULTISPECIES: acyltransferase family protein [Corynebacterium]AJI79244.1 putative acyltransferase [Corynebacterium singulare]OFT63388.1 acetyltransferase [Corynebacterium sp. HMSC05E07]
MTQQAPSRFRYRYDLDGLRGIAIALVVIYHVFVGRVSGGVDVFLLLSGYFFLGSQLRYAARPNASLNPWWPIWRTIRRLVPALVLVIGASYILVRLFAPELMNTELTKQITATVFYYQNWELTRQDADYAAASATTSPLQHMWSMAVQGQFYLIGILFALVLAAFMRVRPKPSGLTPQRFPTVNSIAGPILIVATVASFAYASRDGLFGTPANYYSTWSRAWELTLGAVLVIYGSRLRMPQHLSNLATAVGLAALAGTGLVISDTLAFPGPLSLLPIGGAVLIIIGSGGSFSRVLTSRPSRWLGDIAYPLYLWHWPLLIISTVALGFDTPPWWLGVIIIAVSLGLADLTHRFVEKPLRQHRKRPLADDLPVRRGLADLRTTTGATRAVGGVVVAACTIALIAIQPLWARTLDEADAEVLNPALYPGATTFPLNITPPDNVAVKPDPILARGITPPVADNWCFIPEDQPTDFFFETRRDGTTPCVFGDMDSDVEVYLVGGSHAEQYSSALDYLGREMGFKLVPLTRVGCPIVLGDEVDVKPECAEWSKHVVQRLIDADPALVVSTSTRPGQPFGHGPDAVPPGYKAFWDELAKHEIPFVGFRDNPWGFDDEGNGREFDECYVATKDSLGCGMRFEEVYESYDPGAAVLSQYKNMLAVDTSKWFCNDAGDCPVVIGNVMVYRDMHHFTKAFADSMIPLIRDIITPILNGETVQQEAPEMPTQAAAADTTTAAPPAPTPPRPVPYPMYPAGQAI